jgi:hypothetical protein
MLQQYDRVIRDQIAKRRNLERRYERIFKDDGDLPDDVPEDEERLDDDEHLDDDERLDEDSDEERLDDDSGSGSGNRVDQLADQLVEAGNGTVSREDALSYLLHTASGRALAERMAGKRATSKGKAFTMNRSEQVRAVVRKAGGIMPLCKRIAATGTSTITEHELTSLLVDAAKREHPDLSDAQAFAKMFGAATPQGETLRKAVHVTKVAQVGGDDDGDDDDAAAALQKLHRLAEQHQRDNPALTPDQSFARVFADPRNAALAQRAHRRPVANEKMLYPFPR